MGHLALRSAERASISAICSAGKAPGKLAVARAASTSSSVSARGPPFAGVMRRKPMVRRCSPSSTSGGLLRRSFSRWPLKSVTVTNRSSGWPRGKRGALTGPAAIASSASASRREKPMPPKGASNQRERTRRESLPRTSARVSGATLAETILPGRLSRKLTTGTAQYFRKRVARRASGSSNTSTSARSSHRAVSGSNDWPEWMAWARNTPLMPPALAPATMSGSTRRRRSCCASMLRSMSR